MRVAIAILASTLLLACGPKKDRVIVETPAWESKQGRHEIRLELIKTMVDSKQYKEALQAIRHVRDEGIKDPRLDLLQGMCFARQGLFTEAESLLVRARDQMKRNPDPLHELGVLYADSGKIDLAIQAFQSAVEYDDMRAADWNNMGFLLFSEKEYEQASVALRKAIEVDPTKDKYRINLAYSLFGEEKRNEALRVFKSVLNKADAHYNMGVAHELSGEAGKAEEHYQLALSANPMHTQAQEAKDRILKTKEQPK